MKSFIAILLLSSLGYANTFENIPYYQFVEYKEGKDLTVDSKAEMQKKCEKAIQEKKELVVSMGYAVVEESVCVVTSGTYVGSYSNGLTVSGKIKFLK